MFAPKINWMKASKTTIKQLIKIELNIFFKRFLFLSNKYQVAIEKKPNLKKKSTDKGTSLFLIKEINIRYRQNEVKKINNLFL